MSIESVDEIWNGQTWSDERDGSREYQRVYRVISNDPQESPVTVRANGSIPTLWSAHPNDAAAICTGRTARRIDASRLVWEVTVDYAWAPTDAEDEPDPLNRDPLIRWTSQLVSKPIIKDIDGDAVVNSAGDYFDPPPEAEFPRWNVNIQWNATEVPSAILQYPGMVNSSGITIDGVSVAAERARVVGLDIGELQVENGVEYRVISVVLEVRHADDYGFDLELLDQGYRIKDGDELKDILIEDEDGNKNRPSSPVLLDGSGAKLTDPGPDTAEYLEFEVTRKGDLTVFPGIG